MRCVCPPVCKIIYSLKLVDYLHVQKNKPGYKYYISEGLNHLPKLTSDEESYLCIGPDKDRLCT